MARARIHAPGERGPSFPNRNAGGDSAALRLPQDANRGLQGLRFAPGGVGHWTECRVSAGVLGNARNWKGANRGAYRVRRFAPRAKGLQKLDTLWPLLCAFPHGRRYQQFSCFNTTLRIAKIQRRPTRRSTRTFAGIAARPVTYVLCRRASVPSVRIFHATEDLFPAPPNTIEYQGRSSALCL